MIAQITYAHHVEIPTHSSGNGVKVSRTDNWVLGAAQAVTVFIVEPEKFGTEWKKALTIYFPYGSAKLTEKQIGEIAKLPESAHYRVVGYASYPGSDKFNYELGLNRSKAVASVLKTDHTKTSVLLLSWGSAFASPNPKKYAADQKAVVQVPGE